MFLLKKNVFEITILQWMALPIRHFPLRGPKLRELVAAEHANSKLKNVFGGSAEGLPHFQLDTNILWRRESILEQAFSCTSDAG